MKSREETGRARLTLAGPVTMRDATGKVQKFSTRKAAGVLAILAAAEGKPVLREVLEKALWPGADPEKRSQSLRNALSGIRRQLGEEGPIEITRLTCRLLEDRIETDFPPSATERWAHLATDQEGGWFDDLRQGKVRLAPSIAEQEAPEWLFARVLHQAADEDPERALALMRAAPEMTTQISGAHLIEIVERLWRYVEPARPLFGWLLHFRGVTEYLGGEVKAGMQSFTLAAQSAMTSGDTRLLGETVRWFSAPRVMMGDAMGALVVIEKSLEKAAAKEDDDAVSILLHAKGVSLFHLGRPREADRAMVESREGSYYRRNAAARRQLSANLALFRAVENDRAGVAEMLREIDLVERAKIHWRVAAAGHLTRAILAIHENDLDQADEELGIILDRKGSPKGEFTSIDIYAREYAGVVSVARGDLEGARQHFDLANAMRTEREMGLTAWDRKRLTASMRQLG